MIHCTVQWRTPAPSVRTLAPIQDRFVATLALELRALLLTRESIWPFPLGHFPAESSRQNCSLARAIIMTYFQEGSGLFSAPNDGGMLQQVSKRINATWRRQCGDYRRGGDGWQRRQQLSRANWAEWTSSSCERCQNTANFRLRLHIIIGVTAWPRVKIGAHFHHSKFQWTQSLSGIHAIWTLRNNKQTALFIYVLN